jgi:hypothetical protein
MTIQGVMSPVRARHPFRWALVCALLALTGGFPATRAAYAEVASAVSVVEHHARCGAARHHAGGALAAAISPPLIVASAAHPRDVATTRAVAPLYLTHCALLL